MSRKDRWLLVLTIAGFVVVWAALIGTLAFWSTQPY